MEHLALGARLKQLREAASVTLTEAAGALGAHTATVRRIEGAQTSPDPGQVAELLTLYRVTGTDRDRVTSAVAEALAPGWWHPWRNVMPPGMTEWIAVEGGAEQVRIYSPALVPDLLQTPAYARALATRNGEDADTAEALAQLTTKRQTRLRDQDTALLIVMDAAALHTTVGDDAVMHEQHQALGEAANRPRCTLHISPLTGPPHALTGTAAARLLRVPVPEIGDHLLQHGLAETSVVTDTGPVSRWRAALDTAATATPPATDVLAGLPVPHTT